MQEKTNFKKRRFTKEEDMLIKSYVEDKKCASWEEIASHIPGRNGRQCRDRYNSYLFKEIKNKSRWTKEEDQLLINKYKELGPHWVKISEFFKDRTGNQLKNRWHKGLVKYHGISHNVMKQERRSKMVKFQQYKNKPQTIVDNNKVPEKSKIDAQNDNNLFDCFFNMYNEFNDTFIC